MANSALRLSDGRTDMWRAWIGFNFSHSLGVLLLGLGGRWPAPVPTDVTLLNQTEEELGRWGANAG